MKNNYKGYVMRARKLIKEAESYQFKIAEMAISACKESEKSIADFARDIEIPRRTLAQWVQIYKEVIEKLGLQKPTSTDWAKAAKVHKYMMNEKKRDGRIKKNLPKRKVVQLFKKIDDPERNQFLLLDRALSSAKHICHIVKTTNLEKVQDTQLIELLYSLNEASSHVNEFLIQNRKAS